MYVDLHVFLRALDKIMQEYITIYYVIYLALHPSA